MSFYSLSTSYLGDTLVSGFNWINSTDLSGGFVAYQGQQDALSRGLYSVNGLTQAVTLRVDTTNVYPADGSNGGRPSVRIESKRPVDKGLVIADFAHMPGSVCGSWPAFWMYGSDWPNGGEVDIIEGGNTALKNLMSAHTAEGCKLPSSGFTGSQGSTDCTSPGNNGNIGCGYIPPSSDSFTYGDSFNSIGGGVYAMEWTDAAISLWHFPRTAIPSDITDKQPDSSSWGPPQALFGGSTCDVEGYFKDMSIVLNLDFCGAYAGNLWGVTDTCDVDTQSTCVDWVSGHPEAFKNVYWEINYIDVYDAPASTSTSSTIQSTTSTTSSSSTSTFSVITSGTFNNQSSTGNFPLSWSTASSFTNTLTSLQVSATAIDDVSITGTAPVTSVPAPTPTDSLTNDPPAIGEFVLLGCFGSNSSFSTFETAGTNSAMTAEICVGLCSSRKYAGVFDDDCYCADSLDASSLALPEIDQCNQPCPGKPDEYCGGIASLSTSPAANSTGNATVSALPRRFLRRAVLSSNILLTVYGNPDAGSPNPVPAPALGNPAGSTVTATATLATGPMVTITSTISYTTVCATNPASLVVVSYCATFTVPDCGCSHQTAPPIPLTTIVNSCDFCGAVGESVVTLTVPAAVIASKTAVGDATVTSVPAVGVAQATGGAPVAGNPFVVGNGSVTSASAPAVVTAGANAVAIGKQMLAFVMAGTYALYFL